MITRRIRTYRAIALVLLLITAGQSPAQPLPLTSPEGAGFLPDRLNRLHASMRRFVDEGKYAGLIMLIARHGKIVDFQTYGYRDVERKLPMEKDTLVRIYSMSKLITTVAALQLVEEGRLGLDDPVALYVPELKDVKVFTGGTADAPKLIETKQPVTIRHLLTHTSGYTYDIMAEGTLKELYEQQKLWEAGSLKEFIARASRVPLKHQPGEAFTYGISTDILGYLIGVVTGEVFPKVLQERIFTPLEMKDTSFRVPPEKRSRLAVLYTTGPDGKLRPTEPILGAYAELSKGFPSGGGGLFSTAADYARFAQVLLNGGQLEGKRILSRKMVEAMQVNYLADLPTTHNQFREAYGYGFGVEMRTTLTKGDVPGSLGQFGWYGIATTHCDIDPQERTVTLVLAQHLPFNQNRLFATFNALFYSALE